MSLDLNRVTLEWEHELQCEFTEEQLQHLYQLTHSSSIDNKTQENNYKLLTRWYHVPMTLSLIYSPASDLCWRDCGQRAMFLHMWWECPEIRSFWEDIRDHIAEVLEIDLPFLLLHLHIIKVVLSLIYLMQLNVSYQFTERAHVPSLGDCFRKATEVMEAEEWIATCKGTQGSFDSIWASCGQYITWSKTVSSLDIALLALADSLFQQLVHVNQKP